MDIITRLVLLSICGWAGTQGEPLGRLLARRRDALEAYASMFAREYEPYMFAAVPLHAPVPVLRVLSRARPRDARPAASAQHAVYARPYETIRYYPAAPARYPDLEQEESSFDYGREYARPYYQRPRTPAAPAYDYAAEYDSYAPQAKPSPLPRLTYAFAPYEVEPYPGGQEAAAAAAPAVLYARPTASGGYTYRRAPAAAPAAPAAPAASKKVPVLVKDKEKDPPFIVKIHKYRIVKDDLI